MTKTNHSSAKNCDYFNAVLQTDEGVYSELVCLEPTKKRAFEEAAEEQTPLQLENVYRSPSKLKKYSDVIKFGSPSKEMKPNVDFAYHPFPEPEPKPNAPFIDIKDITLICVFVSIKAYMNINNRPLFQFCFLKRMSPSTRRIVGPMMQQVLYLYLSGENLWTKLKQVVYIVLLMPS